MRGPCGGTPTDLGFRYPRAYKSLWPNKSSQPRSDTGDSEEDSFFCPAKRMPHRPAANNSSQVDLARLELAHSIPRPNGAGLHDLRVHSAQPQLLAFWRADELDCVNAEALRELLASRMINRRYLDDGVAKG